jgi:hypothetical protein
MCCKTFTFSRSNLQMPTTKLQSKYRHLRGGVSSFTNEFSGLINTGFAQLAVHALETRRSDYRFNLLTRECEPPLPEGVLWVNTLFDHIEVSEWLDKIGVRPADVTHFTIEIAFRLSKVRPVGDLLAVEFTARTKIVDNRGESYEWERSASAVTI